MPISKESRPRLMHTPGRCSPHMATTRAITTSGMSPGTSTSHPNPTERGSSATTVSPAPSGGTVQQRGGQAYRDEIFPPLCGHAVQRLYTARLPHEPVSVSMQAATT